MNTLERMLQEMMASGKLDPNLLNEIMAALSHDQETVDKVMDKLREMGADDMGSGPALEIGSFYRAGTEKYTLQWPLSPNLPTLPVPFDQLDRETQFFVLFGEWTRRETEGMMALAQGQLDAAEATFKECLERSKQIDVGELKARSYEGLMKVAQKRNDRTAEREWIDEALKARAGG